MEKIVKQYGKERGIPVYSFNANDVFGGNCMARDYAVARSPTTILVDEKSGKELYRFDWAADYDLLSEKFDDSMEGLQ